MNGTPESEILAGLLAAAQRIEIGFGEALELLTPVPHSAEEFAALGKVQRIAAAAALKRFEQLQDVLARLLRTALIADGTDIAAMTARDIANRMEKVGALPDAALWSQFVRLRNRLAHEYPQRPDDQFDRLNAVIGAIDGLREVHRSILVYLRRQDLVR